MGAMLESCWAQPMWDLCLAYVGLMLGLCWTYVGCILDHVGPLALGAMLGQFWGYVEPMLGQVNHSSSFWPWFWFPSSTLPNWQSLWLWHCSDCLTTVQDNNDVHPANDMAQQDPQQSEPMHLVPWPNGCESAAWDLGLGIYYGGYNI